MGEERKGFFGCCGFLIGVYGSRQEAVNLAQGGLVGDKGRNDLYWSKPYKFGKR